MEKMEGMSMDLTAANIEELKQLFPNAVTEGKVDFEMLRLMLGDKVDASKEKYQFTWNGKAESIKLAQSPSSATLRPCKDKSKNWETTENIYIEGDNLEVLKQLQKTYFGRIKMIYIDPPYNTGNDFVYKDSFHDSITNYVNQTKQSSQSNPETNGRYHTDWLNMMYPRLVLARNLLSTDGVIFISISDEEAFNLKKICDEIFGEKNFLTDLVWNSTKSVTNTAIISVSHTHNLIYFKSWEYYKEHRNEFRLKDDGEGFDNPDNDPRGPWKADPFQVGGWRPNQQYEIKNPKTGEVYKPNPGNSWKNEYSKYLELLKDNRIVFGKTGEGGPQRKRFIWEAEERGRVSTTLWTDTETTTNGTALLKKLFNNKAPFSNPKPVGLIMKMLELGAKKDSIVLDFFSGSGTTAHAVMKFNMENNTNVKFIMIQLPEDLDESLKNCTKDNEQVIKNAIEVCDDVGYKHELTNVAEERIRRAGKTYEDSTANNVDTGFKVFTLDSTNINPWDNTNEYDEASLFNTATVFKLDRSKEDVLYEIMLKYGVFDQPASEVEVNGKTMYRVGQRHMMVCLEDRIDDKDIEEICKLQPRLVVFKEDGFKDDNAKINAEYNLIKSGVDKDGVKCI